MTEFQQMIETLIDQLLAEVAIVNFCRFSFASRLASKPKWPLCSCWPRYRYQFYWPLGFSTYCPGFVRQTSKTCL